MGQHDFGIFGESSRESLKRVKERKTKFMVVISDFCSCFIENVLTLKRDRPRERPAVSNLFHFGEKMTSHQDAWA